MKKNDMKKDLQNAINENLLDQIDSKIESKNKHKSNYIDFAKVSPKEVSIPDIPVVDTKSYKLQIYLDADLSNKLALFMKKNNLSQSKAVRYILKEFFNR